MTTIDLPFPPSVNSIWRQNRKTGKTYLDPKYKDWKVQADNHYLLHKREITPIHGPFNAHIMLDESRPRRGDLDNRIKGILDFLQRVGLIENDGLCVHVEAEWGKVPGCRVTLVAA